LENLFGVEGKELIRPPKKRSKIPATKEALASKQENQWVEDYTEVRDNIKDAIANVDIVFQNAVDEVSANPSARMLETFSLLVKTYSDLNKDLLSIHQSSAKPESKNGGDQPSTVNNNAVFVGDSDSLVDMIRNMTNGHPYDK
jgi:hypothetical protein